MTDDREGASYRWPPGAWTKLPAVVAERDALRAAVSEIRELRGCLGAGPMDYELFVDEIDRVLSGAALGATTTPEEPESFEPRVAEQMQRIRATTTQTSDGWLGTDGMTHTEVPPRLNYGAGPVVALPEPKEQQ